MGSFVARFLTNSPGLGEDLFFSVLGQLPARWGEVMWGPFYPKWGPSGKYLPAPGNTPNLMISSELGPQIWCRAKRSRSRTIISLFYLNTFCRPVDGPIQFTQTHLRHHPRNTPALFGHTNSWVVFPCMVNKVLV